MGSISPCMKNIYPFMIWTSILDKFFFLKEEYIPPHLCVDLCINTVSS